MSPEPTPSPGADGSAKSYIQPDSAHQSHECCRRKPHGNLAGGEHQACSSGVPHEKDTTSGCCQRPDHAPHTNDWAAQKAELIETIQHLAADFDNYKKRIARDQQETVGQASADIIMDLLPILDNFELCLRGDTIPENERKGIEMIYASLLTTLERRGLSVIDAINKPFDPRMHEALLSGEGPAKNTVIEVLQKGYLLNTKVLRTAKVRVST